MILLALFLFLAGVAFCVTAVMTFFVTLFRSFGVEVALQGALASMSVSNMLLLGWGLAAVGWGLLLGSLLAYIADGKNEADDAAK